MNLYSIRHKNFLSFKKQVKFENLQPGQKPNLISKLKHHFQNIFSWASDFDFKNRY